MWGRTVDAFDIGNGLFGSLVAVTGDAHQAQVAQDIFRQEVQIERSLRIREDIRDAHTLMIDNVQTQLLMGNILLGVCFAVLIEGKPDYEAEVPSPVLVQELWAAFSMWSITLLFLSVWFALRFQEVVSLHARKRLLEKHRICTPNDEIVLRMGGMSLAENVSQLHQWGLDQAQNAMNTNYGLTHFQKYIGEPMGLMTNSPSSTSNGPESNLTSKSSMYIDGTDSRELEANDLHAAESHAAPAEDEARRGAGVGDLRANSAAEASASPSSMASGQLEGGTRSSATRRSAYGPLNFSLGQHERPRVSAPEQEDALEIRVVNQPVFDGEDCGMPVVVTAKRGLQAWYEKNRDSGMFRIAKQRMVDLPEFLMGEQLIRCRWEMFGFKSSRRMPAARQRCTVEFHVSGPATLYVAAHQKQEAPQAAFRSKVPLVPWREDELPVLLDGGCRTISSHAAGKSSRSWFTRNNGSQQVHSHAEDSQCMLAPFKRVEGFSIYVDEDKMELPIYRAALDKPDNEGWRFVRLQFRFKDDFVAPVVIVRGGQVTTTEEDWPVTEFLEELKDIWPLKTYSTRYMTLGTVNLVLAAFFAHLGRVLSDRPRESTQEIVIIAVPLILAVVLAMYVIYWDVRHIGIETQTDIHDGHHITDSDDTEDTESVIANDENIEVTTDTANSFGITARSPNLQSVDDDVVPASERAELNAGSDDAYLEDVDRSVQVIETQACERESSANADRVSCWPSCGAEVVCDAEETLFSTPSSNATRQTKMVKFVSELSKPSLSRAGDASVRSIMTDRTSNGGRRGSRGSQDSHYEQPCPNKRNPRKLRAAPSYWCRRCAVPKVTKLNLRRSFAVVLTLWLASLAWIVIAAWGNQPRCFCCAGGLWTVQAFAWPALPFSPSAATLTADGRLLVASRWLLARGDGLRPLRLPSAARGLLAVLPGRVLLADARELRLVDLANVSRNISGNSGFVSLLGSFAAEEGAVGDVAGFLPAALPSEDGELLALAAASALPGGGGGVVAAAYAGGGVLLCSATGLAGLEPKVHALTHVLPLAGSSQVALHVCSAADLDAGGCGAGEPVLWSADASGCLTAVELASGRVHEWQWELGRGPFALAGNLSHLFVVAGCGAGDGGLQPAVRIARYDRLFDEAGHCDHRGS